MLPWDRKKRGLSVGSSHSTLEVASLKGDGDLDARVAVIVGYYEGEKYIEDQVSSILNQTYKNIHIFISDDGSENSLKRKFPASTRNSQISITQNHENMGFSLNFLRSLAAIRDDFDFFAFSDQDDVWHLDKIERAIKAIKEQGSDGPVLYCSRTQIWDPLKKKPNVYSPLFTKPPSFRNALVQNIAGGNTMVLNRKARDLVAKTISNLPMVSHDWWCYLLVTGAGGEVLYDKSPSLKYRQHDQNLVGANTGLSAQLDRIKGLFSGNFQQWNDMNIAALKQSQSILTEENRCILEMFSRARAAALPWRLKFFFQARVYRQSLQGNLGLIAGILFKKV